MIQIELRGETFSLPELRCYHKLSPNEDRLGAVIAAEDPFGKTWACLSEEAAPGGFAEMEIPTGIEDEPYQNIRMRIICPANRHELINALHKSPRKLALAKGFWYEVLAD